MNQPLPKQLARMDQDRMRRYREALDFYQGLQWPGRARPHERRLTMNYAKAVVEKTTSYLMSEVSFTVEPPSGHLALSRSPGAGSLSSPRPRPAPKQHWRVAATSIGHLALSRSWPRVGATSIDDGEARARTAEVLLQEVYDGNNLSELDFDTELDAAVLGDACFKVTWDPIEQRVRVTAPDVQGVFAWWAADDPSRVLQVATRYKASSYVTEVWTDSTFQLWEDDRLVQDAPNPYGFIPFVLYPNLRTPKQFWGESDLAPLLEPARELNRAMSQLSAILELSGNPIAVLENVEQGSDIAVQPGAIWEVPERARAYLLDLLQGGGVQLHTNYIDLLYRTIHDLSETPRTSFGDNSRALSGVALEMELHPLLQKIKRKRLIRTAAYRRRAALMLALLSRFAGFDASGLRVGVHWGPVLPQDRGRLVQEETSLVAAGIHSRRTAGDLLGVADPDTEWARWREEEFESAGPVPGDS